MKILHLSDTHGFHKELPANIFEGIDMVIHSGDCSNWRDTARNSHEVFDFLEWYMTVPVEHKIYVAGNHDTSIEKRLITREHFSDRGITYLEHELVAIGDLKIFGSPYTPTFGEWSFMKSRGNMHKLWSVLPQDIDVLVTHGPPKGVRDLSENTYGQLEQCGDSSLMKWVSTFKPKAHLFGHIHDMSGIHNQGKSLYSKFPTIFSNGACVHDGKFDLGLTSFGNVITLKK
jgi:Icc-related predicted phosphoesterase